MSKNKRSFINRDILALFFVLSFSVFLLFSRDSAQIHNIKFQVSSMIRFFSYPIEWYDSIFIIKEENKFLKQQIVELNLLNAELGGYQTENILLKTMLNFAEKQNLNFLTANVVAQSFGLTSQSISIDIGSSNNVKKNLTVMDENGLLGKTVSVQKNMSIVQLITDKNFRVSIRIGSERALGLFIPTHGKYGILEGVRKSMQLSEGEVAYTSGISEIYPPNIPVAKVISIQNNNNNPFQHIVVELIGSIEKFDYVFIIYNEV